MKDPATWPNALDSTAICVFVVLAFGVPVAGYVLGTLDFLAYLRSLRRALVRVVNYLPHLPTWARHDTPRCLAVFNLGPGCTEEDLMIAYRRKVKQVHPDHGGDRKRFLLMQGYFEEAREWIRRERV
jgi:hypothetical protein